MINLILKRQPKSYQGSRTFKSKLSKTKYIEALETAIYQFNKDFTILTGNLYGVVYYFCKKDRGTDADNISKPIWDCLRWYFV